MLEVKGITIHNTGNVLSAREHLEELQSQGLTYLCHYLVDENEVVECQPITEMAYHTGKGNDYGNKYTIAIEICRSNSSLDLYMKAQRRAINFIKSLCDEYGLTTNNIFFHNDFNIRSYCPHKILMLYGNKANFIEQELKEGEENAND